MASTGRYVGLGPGSFLAHPEYMPGEIDLDRDAAEHSPVLMRSVGTVVFDVGVFVYETIVHMLEPLSTLAYFFTYGVEKSQNQMFTLIPRPSNGFFGALSAYDPLLVMINIALFCCYSERFDDCFVGVMEVVGTPFIFLAAQKLMIGFKYAMLTPAEYKLFHEAPTAVAARWNQLLQLLSGWLPLPDVLLYEELDIASVAIGIDVATCEFVHKVFDRTSDRAWSVWTVFLTPDQFDADLLQQGFVCDRIRATCISKESEAIHKATHRVPAKQLLAILLRLCTNGAFKLPPLAITLIAAFPTFLPSLYRVVGEAHLDPDNSITSRVITRLLAAIGGGDLVVAYCVIATFYITFKFVMVCTLFVAGGVTHFHRNAMLINALAQLARPVIATHPNMPRVQLEGEHAAENLISLMVCLDIALRYGVRYKNRVEAYVGTVWMGNLVVLFGLYATVLYRNKHHIEVNDNISHFELSALIILYCVSVCMLFVVKMILAGAMGNNAFGILAHNLNSRRWRRYCLRRQPNVKESSGNTFHAKDDDPSMHPQDWSRDARASPPVPGTTDEEEDGAVFSLALERISTLAEVEAVSISGFKATTDLANAMTWFIAPLVLMLLGNVFNIYTL